jgi:hypothetical protein
VCVVGTAGNKRIRDDGLLRIVEGLEKNTSLKELHLKPYGVFPLYILLHSVVLSH